MSFGMALAFYKPYNKPFMFIVEAFLSYISSPRLYIWKKVPKKQGEKEEKGIQTSGVYIPPLTESNLKDLAWSLDIKEHDVRKTQSRKPAPLLKDL